MKTVNDVKSCEIHEVYYDKAGKPEYWTEDSVSPFGESVNELKSDLNNFLKAFNLPVLKMVVENGKEILVEDDSLTDNT